MRTKIWEALEGEKKRGKKSNDHTIVCYMLTHAPSLLQEAVKDSVPPRRPSFVPNIVFEAWWSDVKVWRRREGGTAENEV